MDVVADADEDFRGKDEATLKDLLDSCVKFEERKKIRKALREKQGLSRQTNGGIKPLSFRPRNVKSASTSAGPDLGKPTTKRPVKTVPSTEKPLKNLHYSLSEEETKRIELEHLAWRSSLSDESQSVSTTVDCLSQSNQSTKGLKSVSATESLTVSEYGDDLDSVFTSPLPNVRTEFFEVFEEVSPDKQEDFENLNGEKQETLNKGQNRPCRFLLFGKITSDIPRQINNVSNFKCTLEKSESEFQNKTEEMDGSVKNFRSKLTIGSLGKPKTAKSSFQAITGSGKQEGSSENVKRCNSLKIIKTNHLKTNGSHDGGTVITEEIRRKSLDHGSVDHDNNLYSDKDSGTKITPEMRRKSLDSSSSADLKNLEIQNNDIEIKISSVAITECNVQTKKESVATSDEFSLKGENFENQKQNIESENQNLKIENYKKFEEKSNKSDKSETSVHGAYLNSEMKTDLEYGTDGRKSVIESENLEKQSSSTKDEGCKDCQKNQDIDSPIECNTKQDLVQLIEDLQTQLRECPDFTKRRRIRGRIRKIREQIEAFDLRRKPNLHQQVDNHTRIGVSREITPNGIEGTSEQAYHRVDSKDELRKLLSQTSDYDEKKQIRLALRQLRQRDRERESGDSKSGPTPCLTRSQSAKDFSSNNYQTSSRPSVARHTSVVEESAVRKDEKLLKDCHINENKEGGGLSRNLGQSHSQDNNGRLTPENQNSQKSDSDENSPPSPLRRSFSLNTLQKRRLEKEKLRSPINNLSNNCVQSDSPESCSSSSEFSEHSLKSGENSKIISNHSSDSNSPQNSLKHSKNNRTQSEKHSTDLEKSRRSSVPASAKPFKDSEEYRSGSESDSSSCRDWLENKRRNSLTVIDTKKLNSTMDIEAAFSEILNAVDTENEDINDEDESPELEISELDGQENISIKTPRVVSEQSISTVEISLNNNEIKPVLKEEPETPKETEVTESKEQITPVKQQPVLKIAPPSGSMCVIEDDDGSITVQSVSFKDEGNHTVTEKTTLRRSQSRSEEEEKDTVIESKVTSPGGSDHFEKDVIKTKRKITSRGSDYYSRSQFKTKWLRNKEGETIEEHDVMLESDNFSVTQGQSWGDRSEATVQLNKATNQIPNVVPEIQEPPNRDSGENRLQVHGLNRMDVSKASSGYGSVSGSDEEEKEEAVTAALQGKPTGSPEIVGPLKDLITLEGSNAVLECIVTCSPPPDITWYKGDKSLMNNKHYEPKYDSNSGRATLTVLMSSKDDCGPYKCVFRNPLGEAETKAVLTVRSRAKKKPTFTKPLRSMTATEGHSVCLECAVNDATQVAWYKDGIIQRNTSDFKQTFDGLIAKLEIDEIFVDDNGEYACVAKNDFGENKSTCRINVKETACETDVVPMFLTKPESKIHECEDTITLQCDVIGSPQPTIIWCRDQQVVESDNHHKQAFDGRTAVLLITKATVGDSGKYECIAKNTSGKVSVDALIVVKAKQACPEILAPLSNETATFGKALVLKCDVKGNPSPMIVWRKDSRIIGNTKDFRQTYQDVTAKLQISDVHKEDAGCYECVARNVHGAVTTKCVVTVEGVSSGTNETEVKSKKPLDWLVGRDNTPKILDDKPKETVKRSESMKVTSNYSLRDKYRTQQRTAQVENTIQENAIEPVPVVKEPVDKNNDNDTRVDINMNKTKFEDPLKQKMAMARTKSPEDPPWKNVTLRRTESARAPVGRRESPFLRKRKEELAEKMDEKSTSQNNIDPSQLATKPPGLSPVIADNRTGKDVQMENEIISALRKVNLRRSDSARCIRDEQKQFNNNFGANNDSDFGSKTDNVRASRENDGEVPKVGQTSSTRLLFERKLESDAGSQPLKDTPVNNFLNRPGSGLRRTSSLKITQAERDSGTRPIVHSRFSSVLDMDHSTGIKTGDRRFVSKEGDQRTTDNMTSYDTIDDEEELHKILSKTDDFDERKKIRNRMRELREKKSKEFEVKRIQREKETEDIIKKKFQAAEEDQKRQIKAFEKAAQESKAEREKILKIKDDRLKESMKAQDEAKKKQLEAFDRIARKGGEGVVKQQAGFGGASYSKTPEQAAKYLSDKLINTGSPVIGGKITVRTESWNSQDGVTNKSEKTETWGAQPQGAQGAMNKFKAMEPAGAAKPNGLIAVSLAKRAAKTMQRNAVAIKQEILHFVNCNIQGYENVEVTNFSTSWNNGMAFCALIHHFYPESFDFSRLDPKKRRGNFKLAFDIAEKYADIAPLLDVDDMVKMQKPDWKCVFTYVQSFYRKLHDHPNNCAAAPKAEQ